MPLYHSMYSHSIDCAVVDEVGDVDDVDVDVDVVDVDVVDVDVDVVVVEGEYWLLLACQ